MGAMAATNLGGQPKTGAPAAAAASAARPGGFWPAVRDLAWLVRRVARASPRAAAGWAALSLGLGFVTPVELWATKGVADNLQIHLDGGDGSAMWRFAALFLLASTFSIVFEPYQEWCAAAVRERGGTAIGAETLDKATRIDLASYEHQPFYNRFAVVLTSADDRANQVLGHVVGLGWAAPRIVSYLVVLLAFDWRLAILALLSVAPSFYGWFFTGTMSWDIRREQTRDRRLADYYAGLLADRQAAKEVRLFGLAPTLLARWEELYWTTARDLRNRSVRAGMQQRTLSLSTFAISMLGLAWYVSSAPAIPSAGTVVIVVASYVDMYSVVFNFARPIQELGKSAGFANDVRTFISLPDEDDGRQPLHREAPTASELVLEGVTYTYPGTAMPALTDVSLRIAPGETIALVGENGAGKTTLVKLMLGLLQPDCGRIILDGEDLATVEPTAVRARLSGVFQHFTRYPMTARDNITLGNGHGDREVERALDLVGLARLPERLPDGLDTMLAPDLGGIDLSGGQWQRLAIARAGIRGASLVALDEPTAALDPLAEVAIYRRFADLAATRTTILVSHRLGMARLAKRIVCLEHGQVVEDGRHDDLVARPGSRYAEMWEAQARWYR